MAETYTANYHWTLPEVQHSPSTWGGFLNDTLSKIDGQVFANQNLVTAISGYLTPNSLTLAKIAPSTSAAINFINGAAPTGKQTRWVLYEGPAAETGGNVSSNFNLDAYDDNGVLLGQAFTVARSSRTLSLTNQPLSANDAATKQYVDMGMVPIGGIIMWPSATLPPRFTWCLGAHLNAASYPQLFNVIGGAFFWDGTNFGLPNMAGRCVLGYDGSVSPNGWYLGRQDGEYTHVTTWGEMPQHNHGVGDPGHAHNIYDGGHTHGASQDNHIHYDAGHVHGVSASQDGHDHGSPQNWLYPGSGAWTTYVGGQRLDQGGRTDWQTPAVHVAIATNYANIGGASASNVYINAAGTGIGIYGAGTGVTIGNAGSSAAHNNMQPSIVLGYIIRYA